MQPYPLYIAARSLQGIAMRPINVICPVSSRQVNANAVRLVALSALALLSVGALWTELLPWITGALALDYAARGFTRFSGILGLFARSAATGLGISKRPINAGPKIFAARLGTIFCATAAILSATGQTMPALAVCGIMGFCAALEAFFGLCVGCHAYTLLRTLFGGKGTTATAKGEPAHSDAV
jgi:hypothetical protein